MGRAETRTKLPLAEWARIMGINPLHFEGVILPADRPSVCAQPWFQHPWQDADRVGREDVAIAIARAEEDIERFLRARLLPAWEADEWKPTIRFHKPEMFNLSASDVRGMAQVVQTQWGHMISPGVEKKDEIELDVAIAWASTLPPVAYADTGTVAIAALPAAVTKECEIHIYYPGKSGADEWEIRPINVSITAGAAAITFKRELTVLESLQEDPETPEILGTVDGNFLTTVDVYRKWNDPQTQVSFLWEPTGICGCGNATTCVNCAYSTQTGCLMLRGDPKLGVVSYRPGTWDAANDHFDAAAWAVSRQPDIVRLYYLAGIQDLKRACPTVQMDPAWARTVAYYAAALFDRGVCECNNVHAWVERMRQDLAANLENVSFQISEGDLDNPFGTRRGGIDAWKRVKNAREAVTGVVM